MYPKFEFGVSAADPGAGELSEGEPSAGEKGEGPPWLVLPDGVFTLVILGLSEGAANEKSDA